MSFGDESFNVFHDAVVFLGITTGTVFDDNQRFVQF